jgi:hypothetical protein
MEIGMGMDMDIGIGMNMSADMAVDMDIGRRGMPISRSSTNLQSLANGSEMQRSIDMNNATFEEQDTVLSSSWSSSWAGHTVSRGR